MLAQKAQILKGRLATADLDQISEDFALWNGGVAVAR
jgi:hypothetical protein